MHISQYLCGIVVNCNLTSHPRSHLPCLPSWSSRRRRISKPRHYLFYACHGWLGPVCPRHVGVCCCLYCCSQKPRSIPYHNIVLSQSSVSVLENLHCCWFELDLPPSSPYIWDLCFSILHIHSVLFYGVIRLALRDLPSQAGWITNFF